jgi:amino acid transporter
MLNYVFLQCAMTLLMLVSGDVYVLINYAAFVESLFIGISILGLLWLRYKRPTMERPIKVSACLLSMIVLIHVSVLAGASHFPHFLFYHHALPHPLSPLHQCIRMPCRTYCDYNWHSRLLAGCFVAAQA